MKIIDNRTKKTVAPINREPCEENQGNVFADGSGVRAFFCARFASNVYRWVSPDGSIWSMSDYPLSDTFLPVNAHIVLED